MGKNVALTNVLIVRAWGYIRLFWPANAFILFKDAKMLSDFHWNSMRCKTTVFPKASNRLLQYLLLNSNSYTFSAVTKLLTFLNSHFYLSHHLRMPSAVYLKYIQLSITYFFRMFLNSTLVGTCFSFCFIFGLFI